AYRFHTRAYALLVLKERVARGLDDSPATTLADLLLRPSPEPRWEHARRLLREDFGIANVVAALRQLPAVLDRLTHDVTRSKARDGERGRRIIDDYDAVHTPTDRDPFVQETRSENSRLRAE